MSVLYFVVMSFIVRKKEKFSFTNFSSNKKEKRYSNVYNDKFKYFPATPKKLAITVIRLHYYTHLYYWLLQLWIWPWSKNFSIQNTEKAKDMQMRKHFCVYLFFILIDCVENFHLLFLFYFFILSQVFRGLSAFVKS